MKSCVNKINRSGPVHISAVAIIVTLVAAQNIFAQTTNWLLPKFQVTNSIPTNIFLTDNGFLLKFKKSGEMVVDVQSIKDAEKSPESRPAIKDPQGNWGEATNGFQMSIRLAKTNYSAGEPVTAIVLIRNVAQKSETYFRPVGIVAMRNGNVLKRKNGTGPFEITVPPQTSLFPQTQHRYQIEINKDYDLGESGNYTFQAECKQPGVASKKVTVLITNAPAK